jgi:4a-hydroxytetrahydrobiopterin dehydratase
MMDAAMEVNTMTTASLTEKKCKPCEGGVPPLSNVAAVELMKALHSGWAISDDGKSISRSFRFENFAQTMGFVNALAWVAESEDHHPNMEVGFRDCVVRWNTHAIDGLSENDFICAAKTDRLLA